jgi:hypothetical protein
MTAHYKVPLGPTIKALADRAGVPMREVKIGWLKGEGAFVAILWFDPRSRAVMVVNGDPRLVNRDDIEQVPGALIRAVADMENF